MPSENESTQPPRDESPPAAAPSPADSRSEEGEARSDDSRSENEATDEAAAAAAPLPDEPVPGTKPSTTTTTANREHSASAPPPLPTEAPPGQREQEAASDDGWSAEWDATHQAWYFYNRFTGVSQWDNPRVLPTAAPAAAPGTSSSAAATTTAAPPPTAISQLSSVAGGYNPAIHGSWDPNAPYAQAYQSATTDDDPAVELLQQQEAAAAASIGDPLAAEEENGGDYAQNAAFNRRTGKFQQLDEQDPERYSDASTGHRQMNAFFDVDRAANSHDGRSLKAERRGKQPTKKELAMWKEKRKARKEEKRRAWLRD